MRSTEWLETTDETARRRGRWALVLVLALTAAAYAGVGQAGFVWDDAGLVTGNERLATLQNIPSFFHVDFWFGVKGVAEPSGYYRPLFLTYLAVVRSLVGESAPALHVLGLGWHLAAVAALYCLLERISTPFRAVAGVAVFALHPVQSEAVVWISANNDPMAATLGLIALNLALPVDARPARLCAVGLAMAASALTKESVLLLPFALPLLDWAMGTPRSDRRFMALVGGVVFGLSLRAAAGVAAPPPLADGWLLLWARLGQLFGLAGSLLSVPWPLSGSRPLDWPLLVPWREALGFLTLAAGFAAVAMAGRWGRLARAGLVVAGLSAAPSVVAITAKGLFGERYLYLPMVGVGLAVAAVLPARAARLLPLLGATWLVVLFLRLPDWANDLSLWQAAMRDTPNPHAAVGLADAYNTSHDYSEAVEYYSAALAEDPPAWVACPRVVNTCLRMGSRSRALERARWAAARGCAGLGEFTGAWALAEAENGKWDVADWIFEPQKYPPPKDVPADVRSAVHLALERASPSDRAAESASSPINQVPRIVQGDPTGIAEVVWDTLLLVRGDRAGYEQQRMAWAATASAPLDEQVTRILVAGGRADLAPVAP